MDIPREVYDQQKRPRFGRSNPQRMDMPFWEFMVRSRYTASQARDAFDDTAGEGPVWCFKRFGMSRRRLADGRRIFVGGEHEDFYDADFCIYNDVIVSHPDGRIEIFGYPEEVFPPTDFHTATLIGKELLIVGSLGYKDARQPGTTPVYRLDCDSLRIERVETAGENPGWISRHKAQMEPSVAGLVVWGGRVVEQTRWREKLRRNEGRFRLDLATLEWRRLA